MTEIDTSFSLERRTAVVTGGASGIGLAISELFAERGATVAVVDMDAARAADVASRLGNGSRAYTCNVTDSSSVAVTVDEIILDLGAIDVLVNSAGIVALAPAEELTDGDWERTLSVNLTGTFFMSRAIGSRMLEAGQGTIINMASQAGTIALDQHAAYCASKFGVIGLTKVLASEWAGRGVTANTISPTVVLTELGKKAWEGPKGDALKKLIPTGRFALPEEIAAAALYLASPAARMVNGADLMIDGGYSIR